MPPEINPRAVFERLFGDSERNARGARQAPQLQQEHSRFRSRRHAAAEGRPGPDRPPQDGRISGRGARNRAPHRSGRARFQSSSCPPSKSPPASRSNSPITCRLMFDLMTLAFQADLTRISTFMMCREGSTRTYREIGVSDAHHPLTHHRNNPEWIEKVAKINCFHMEQFAYFVGQAEVHAGWRRHAARSRDGGLRQRPGRRQPAHAQRSAGAAGGRAATARSAPAATCAIPKKRR